MPVAPVSGRDLPGRSGPLEPTAEPAATSYQERPLDIPLALATFNDPVSTAEDTVAFLAALMVSPAAACVEGRLRRGSPPLEPRRT